MIAVDTNILVHAHREESAFHAAASATLAGVAVAPWAIPWPCVHEFLAIVTHPKIFDPPSPIADALLAVESWRAAPTLSILAEGPGYWELLQALLSKAQVAGPRIHDARIAAICLLHATTELLTADRDFSRFPGLRTRNPLLA
jgi:uncharacterized protein